MGCGETGGSTRIAAGVSIPLVLLVTLVLSVTLSGVRHGIRMGRIITSVPRCRLFGTSGYVRRDSAWLPQRKPGYLSAVRVTSARSG
jgi:hypothetical protein